MLRSPKADGRDARLQERQELFNDHIPILWMPMGDVWHSSVAFPMILNGV